MNRSAASGILPHMSKPSFKNTIASSEKADRPAPATANLPEETIAQVAYRLWAERGVPDGSPDEDWFRAQDLLRARQPISASSTL